MHSLFLIFLFFCAISAFDVPIFGSNGNKTKPNATIIHNPAVPFARHGVVYYWNGYYKNAPSTPKKCVFLRSHPDWPFGEYLHLNGTIVTGVEFGCRKDDLCRKYRCDQIMASGLVWCAFLLMSAIVSVAIIVRYVVGLRREERTEQDTELRSVYMPVVVVNQEPSGGLEVPPWFPNN